MGYAIENIATEAFLVVTNGIPWYLFLLKDKKRYLWNSTMSKKIDLFIRKNTYFPDRHSRARYSLTADP